MKPCTKARLIYMIALFWGMATIVLAAIHIEKFEFPGLAELIFIIGSGLIIEWYLMVETCRRLA